MALGKVTNAAPRWKSANLFPPFGFPGRGEAAFRRQEAALDRIEDDVGLPTQSKLVERLRAMGLDRPWTDLETAGDFGV